MDPNGHPTSSSNSDSSSNDIDLMRYLHDGRDDESSEEPSAASGEPSSVEVSAVEPKGTEGTSKLTYGN